MLPVELRGDTMAQSQARELLEKVGLADRLDHYPRQLSGGEQQRVAIARAFASNPTVLFADEPRTGNLDTQTGELICQLLFDLNTEFGNNALVMVTHDYSGGPLRTHNCYLWRAHRAQPVKRGGAMNFKLVARMAWRDVRSGEMGLLLVALLVVVGTVTSISLFVDRLQSALLEESSNFLAADRQISSGKAIPEEFVLQAQQRGSARRANPSVSLHGFYDDLNQLVSVKAVDATYPLRGELIVGSEPFKRGAPTDDVPEPGTVWLDSRLFPAMNLDLGDSIEVGMAKLTVARVLIAEPDRGGSIFDFGPAFAHEHARCRSHRGCSAG